MNNSADVIKKILLTEKGTRLSEEQNQYLFRVAKAVNTMRRKGKKKRQRTAQFGTTASWKRAVVTLHEDDSISLI